MADKPQYLTDEQLGIGKGDNEQAPKQYLKESDLGIAPEQDGAFMRGLKTAGQSIKMTGQLTAGDAAGVAQSVKEAELYRQKNPGTKEGDELAKAWDSGDGISGGVGGVAKEFAKDWSEADSFVGGLRATGKNLEAMRQGLVSQVGNSIAPMVGLAAGAAAGGAAGSAAPIVGNAAGAVAGGWAGASLGNTLVEGGGQVQDALQKAGIDPLDTPAVEKFIAENGDRILGQSAIKGGIIGAVDTATAGAGGKLLKAPINAAMNRAFATLGIDAADKVAVKAAIQSGEIARHVAADPIYQASQKGAQKLIREGTVAALDPAGEFTGEYVGQGVATGDWDTKNAALEALSSVGQSGIMYAGQKGYQYATNPLRGSGTANQNSGTATPAAPGQPLQLGNSPDPLIQFRDGTVARQSEIDAHLASLPESERQTFVAQILGYAPQQADEPQLTTSPGATQFDGVATEQPSESVAAPDFGTSLGAQPEQQGGGLEFQRQIDTSGLSLERLDSPFAQPVPATALDRQALARQGAYPINPTPAPVLDTRRLSEKLGLSSNRGGLEAAAAMAVDSGASPISQAVNTNAFQQVDINGTQTQETQQAVAGQSQGAGAQERVAAAPKIRAVKLKDGTTAHVNEADLTSGASLLRTFAADGKPRAVRLPAANIAPAAPKVVLQNRNRATPASIAQMNAIASKPDFLRTGASNTMDNGAPIVFGDLPQKVAIGRAQMVADGNGQRVPTQYAVVEAQDLITSNHADGSPVAEYANGVDGKLRAVAGNGRAAGLKAAWQRGTAGQYGQELVQDAPNLGIAPDVLAQFEAPVLVRVMDAADVTPDMGDRSNVQAGLQMSAVEQASNDAQRLNLRDMEFDELGNPTAQTVMRFMQGMPVQERGNMLDSQGRATSQLLDRIRAAAFKQAYMSDSLVELAAQSADPEAKNILNGLAIVAGDMAQLAGTGDFDIRQAVTDAANMAVTAARTGQSLAQYLQTRQIDENPETVVVMQFMAQNVRSAKRIADGLRAWAELAQSQIAIARQNAEQDTMFGDTPTLSRRELFERLNNDNLTEIEQQQLIEQQRRAELTKQGTQRPSTERAGNADGASDGAESRGTEPTNAQDAGREQTDFALEQQTPEQIRAQEEAQAQAARDKAQADARAAEAERKAVERQEETQRSEAAANDFQLGQSAEDNLSGQGDIFAQQQEATPEAPPKTLKEGFERVRAKKAAEKKQTASEKAEQDEINELRQRLLSEKHEVSEFSSATFDAWRREGLERGSIKGWTIFHDDISNTYKLARKFAIRNEAGGGYVRGEEITGAFASADEAKAWVKENPQLDRDKKTGLLINDEKEAKPAPAQSKNGEGYALPNGSVSDSWRDKDGRYPEHPNFAPNDRQKRLIAEVKKAREKGLFYNEEIKNEVASSLGVSDEIRAINTTGVDGGDFGYDIYHAMKALDAQQKETVASKIRAELSLNVGDQLGTLVFNDFKQTNKVEVVGLVNDDRSVKLKGKRGVATATFEADVPSVKYAIERAHEKGKRKDSYEEFIASRSSRKQTNEATGNVQQAMQDAVQMDHLSREDLANVASILGVGKGDKPAKNDATRLGSGATGVADNALSGKDAGAPYQYFEEKTGLIRDVPSMSNRDGTLNEDGKRLAYTEWSAMSEDERALIHEAIAARKTRSQQADDSVRKEYLRAEKARLEGERIILSSNGNPYKTEGAAAKFIEEKGIEESHYAGKVDGGWAAIRRTPSEMLTRENEKKGIEDYTTIQERIVGEMGLTQAWSQDAITDAQWEEIDKRVDAIQRQQRGLPAIEQPPQPATPPKTLKEGIEQARAKKAAEKAEKTANEVPVKKVELAAARDSAESNTETAAAVNQPSRPDKWRGNKLQAAKVARDLGLKLDIPKISILDLVRAIDAHDAKANGQEVVVAPAKPKKNTPFAVGNTPSDTEKVTVRDGTVFLDKYEAIDYESGEPVTVPKGSTRGDVVKALRDAGAISKNTKVFGASGEQANDLAFSRNTGRQNDGIEGVRDLVVLHNLTEDNLRNAAKIGGLPAPSLGIAKAETPFSGYGNITLIGTRDMIDPQQGVPVYDRDAYTARFPEMHYKKPKRGNANALYERMQSLRELGDDGSRFQSMLFDILINSSSPTPARIAELFDHYNAPRMLYAQEVLGKTIKTPMRDVQPSTLIGHDKELVRYWQKHRETFNRLEREMDDAAFRDTPEYKAFEKEIHAAINRVKSHFAQDDDATYKRISKRFTDSLFPNGRMDIGTRDRLIRDFGTYGKKEIDVGKLNDSVYKTVKRGDAGYTAWVNKQMAGLFDEPTITLRGKQVAPTLDNLVAAMTIGGTVGAEKTMTASAGKTSAMLGKRFKSVAEIQAARAQVVSSSQENDAKKSNDEILAQYRTSALAFFTKKDWRGEVDTWAGLDASMEALANAGKKGGADAAIRQALAAKGFRGVDAAVIDLAKQSIDALRNSPTEYFEAKPQRAVGIGEFRGAVLPRGTDPNVLELLAKHGVQVLEYGKGEGAREKAIATLAKRLDRGSRDVLFSATDDGAANLRTKPKGATTSTIRHAASRAYGKLLERLEAKGLVHVAQTEEAALQAAAKARAAKTGQSVAQELNGLRQSVQNSIAVWHGTPHRGIERTGFKLNKIGTGEGAQAYGWGIYFASQRVVAEGYRETLTGLHAHRGSETINAAGERLWQRFYDRNSRGEKAVVWQGAGAFEAYTKEEFLKNWLSRPSVTNSPEYKEEIGKALKGQLYGLDLPVEESDLLDWDKPLSEQSPKVLDALKSAGILYKPTMTGSAFYQNIQRNPTHYLDKVLSGLELTEAYIYPDRGASMFLNALGIPGLRYLDGNSRADGKGSHNYVIWDEALLTPEAAQIDAKFSKDGAIEGFFDRQTGKSFLVADGLTEETAPATLMHEVGIHMAADGSMQGVFNRAAMLVKNSKDEFMNRVRDRMEAAGETSAEEAAAYIVTEYEKDRTNAPASIKQFMKDFLAAVRAWLFRNGFTQVVKEGNLTPADISAIARANARSLAQGGQVAPSVDNQTYAINEPNAPYETDLFGEKVQAPRVRNKNGVKPDSTPIGNIQPATALSDTAAPDGEYYVKTIVGSEVERKLGASRISTAADAARATAYLYRSAVERFDGIVTDKDGKPLAVVGGFKGALSQASVYPSTIMGEAIRVPGAARIWFSHNHPSGLSTLSSADKTLFTRLVDIFNGSGIEPMGMLAVSNGEFSSIATNEDPVQSQAIPSPSVVGAKVPVIERELAINANGREEVNSPAVAMGIARKLHSAGGDGIMLFDSQMRLAAWVPISDVMRGTLRHTGGLAAVYRAISESNAGSAILVHDGSLNAIHRDSRSITVGNNIAAALRQLDVSPLDIINIKTLTSAAQSGGVVAAGPVYSKESPAEAQVRELVAQYANTEGAPTEAEIREAVRQYHGTERAYGGQDAYAKAKADGKTKLNYGQWVQVRTPNFKAWFGDWENDPTNASKVVDSQTGEPLVVYHGTTDSFNKFDPKLAGKVGDRFADASFLASSPVVATGYSHRLGQDAEHERLLEIEDKRAAEYRKKVLEQWEATRQTEGAIVAPSKAAYESAKAEREARRLVVFNNDVPIEGANVMPVFVRAFSPIEVDAKGENYHRVHGPAFEKAARDNADGVIVRNVFDAANEVQRELSDVIAVFTPTQIKSATGNNGNFDGANPDIRFSRAAPTAGAGVWQPPEPTKFDQWTYLLQDKQIDTKRVLNAIKSTGQQVDDAQDVYLQETLYHGRTAKRVKDFAEQEERPLMELMRDKGLSLGQVEEYLHARHAPEANKALAERNPSAEVIAANLKAAQAAGDEGEAAKWRNAKPYTGTEEDRLALSGMSDAEAAAVMAALTPEQRTNLQAAAEMVDAIIAKTRQTFVDYGLETQETVDAWGKAWAHYVPLMREQPEDTGMAGMGTGQGFSVKGKEVKGRTGSTKKVVDILANINMQRERAIVRGEKNRVAMALLGLVKANPNKDFWRVATAGEVPSSKVVDERTGLVRTQIDPLYKSRDNALVVKVDGQEQVILFNEDNARAMRMAAALKNMDAANLEGMLGNVASVTRYLAAINTQYNPIFGIVNMVRDFQEAAINLQATPLAGKQKQVLGQALTAVWQVGKELRAQREGKTTGSEWGKLWEDFQAHGGQTGYRDMFTNSADRSRALQALLQPDAWADTKWGKFFSANGTLKAPMEFVRKTALRPLLDLLSDYNEAIENGVRLSAYKTAIEQGMSLERAAELAKNLTVNFNRKGQVAQQVGALYAFFNASVQGTARMGQTLFNMEPGQPKTMRLSPLGKKIVGGAVLLGSVQALLLAAAGFGEDEPPEFIRERNLVIPNPLADKGYTSIPMPLGYHVLANLGRIPTEYALGGFKDGAKRAVSIVDVLADIYNPLGGGGLSMQTISPTVLDPFAALAENKDFTGRSIAKESFNKTTPGHALGRDTSSFLANGLSQAINYATGGTEYTRGEWSPTPDQIDYLLGQALGGVGREASKVSQTAQALATGDDLPWHKVPLIGRFYGSSDTPAAVQSAYYATMDDVRRHAAEVKGLRNDGRGQEAVAYMQENPQAGMHFAANAAERQVKKLRERISDLKEQGAPREAVRAVETQMVEVMQRFSAAVENRKKLVSA